MILATTKASKLQKFSCNVDNCKNYTKFANPYVIDVNGKCFCWSHESDINSVFYSMNRIKAVARCESLHAKLPLPKNEAELTAFKRAFEKVFGMETAQWWNSWKVWLDMTNLYQYKTGRA